MYILQNFSLSYFKIKRTKDERKQPQIIIHCNNTNLFKKKKNSRSTKVLFLENKMKDENKQQRRVNMLNVFYAFRIQIFLNFYLRPHTQLLCIYSKIFLRLNFLNDFLQPDV